MKKLFWLFAMCLTTLACAQGYRPTGEAAVGTSYIFGVHPYTNPQSMLEDYTPVIRYLEQQMPGTRFEIEASKDYADYEAKLAAKRFHFSLPNPYQTLIALEHGYKVVAKMTPDENFRGLIIARTDSPIKTPTDLNGKTLCFVSPTAVAATMLPLLHLSQQGVDVKSLQIKYVGSQDSTILNTYAGDAAVCGSTVRFFGSWAKKNPDRAKEIQVLWRTQSLPHNGFVARDDVPPAVARRAAELLAGLDKDPAVDQGQFKKNQQHFELATDETYRPMRKFLADYDKAIGLPSTMQVFKDR